MLKCKIFDKNWKYTPMPKDELISKIKNLQSNIMYELTRFPINFDYIEECNKEIQIALESIKELVEDD